MSTSVKEALDSQIRPTFQKALENLINQYSMERAGGNTPDFLLAEYLNMCLTAYSKTVNERDKLTTKTPKP